MYIYKNKQKSENNLTFTPQINQSSGHLAQKFRTKVLKETAMMINNQELQVNVNNAISDIDLQMLQKKAQEVQHQKQAFYNKESELQHCTFQPVTNSKNRDQSAQRGIDKSKELYNYNKKIQYIAKAELKEYYKQQDNCTFKPVINNTYRKTQCGMTKGEQQQVERIQKGRELRDYQKGITEIRNYDNWSQVNQQRHNMNNISFNQTQKSTLSTNQKQNQQSENETFAIPQSSAKKSKRMIKDDQPVLFVDVNIGHNKSERIIVNEGDTAKELAETFSKKHDLDETMKEKLIELLDNQMQQLLLKIDEVASSET